MDLAGVVLGSAGSRLAPRAQAVAAWASAAHHINSLLRVVAAVRDNQLARGWTEEEIAAAP
eukprot:10608606-Alexandrium_andersonii.AAC.1